MMRVALLSAAPLFGPVGVCHLDGFRPDPERLRRSCDSMGEG